MSDEPITPVEPAKRKRSWVGRSIVVGIFLLIFVILLPSALTSMPVLYQLPFHVACGSALHAYQTLPLLLADWLSALRPLAALVVAGFMLHRFVRWAIRADERSRPWQPGHTLAAMALLLLGYGTAITLIGIAHQSTWLLSERWIDDGMASGIEKSRAARKVRSLVEALEAYDATHGHYPESLRELNVPPEMLLVETGSGAGLEPFLYLKPDDKKVGYSNEPIIVSPMVGHQEFMIGFIYQKYVLGFGGTSVLKMHEEGLEKLIQPAAPAPLPTTPPTADE